MTAQDWMREALKEAQLALEQGEIPVGAVVVRDGELIARAHNESCLLYTSPSPRDCS